MGRIVGSLALGVVWVAAMAGCRQSPVSGQVYGCSSGSDVRPAAMPPRDAHVVSDAAEACPPVACGCPAPLCPDDYPPQVPIAENRSTFLVMVVPPSPFLLTQGQADTPARGGLSVYAQRVSDERNLRDNKFNIYSSDGEVQIISVEYVSPCLPISLGRARIPLHLGLSSHVYSLEEPLFDEVRNFVEGDILGASGDFIANRSVGGRDLFVDPFAGSRIDMLKGYLLKLKGVVKADLPDACVFHHTLQTAVSVGVTAPAIGEDRRSASDSVGLDAALAFALPLASRLRLTGALALSMPGGSPLLDDLGVAHEDLLFAAHANLEWWFHPRWAFTAGLSHHTNYTKDTGLPMDLDSNYLNLGFLFQATWSSTFYFVWTENIEPRIDTGLGTDFTDSQKEADFTFALGWRLRF